MLDEGDKENMKMSSDDVALSSPCVTGYTLAGIISHIGSTQFNGHYVFDRYHVATDTWTCYNDARVTENLPDQQKQRHATAYILTYTKNNK